MVAKGPHRVHASGVGEIGPDGKEGDRHLPSGLVARPSLAKTYLHLL